MYLTLREKYTFTVIGVTFNEKILNTFNECYDLLKVKEEEFRQMQESNSVSITKEYEKDVNGVSYEYNKFYITAIPDMNNRKDVSGFGAGPRTFILTIGEFKNDVTANAVLEISTDIVPLYTVHIQYKK